jgi:hypothetical protein
MATKLEGEQKLRRLVKVYGLGEVEVSFSQIDGIEMRVPGTRTYISLPWQRAIEQSLTPASVKSYHMGKPVELLKAMLEKRSKREEGI